MENKNMVLHKCEFFLFGMGNRSKYFYKSGRLIESISGNVIVEWSITFEEIIPEEYMVKIKTTDNKIVHIYENESGVYIDDNSNISIITKGKLNLPSFEGHKYQRELKILHHEILINILDGKPLPNYFVYKKPWYRDSAMMCMVLKLTQNLHLVEDWIINLNEIFDRNNAGNKETDNLGQALYMI